MNLHFPSLKWRTAGVAIAAAGIVTPGLLLGTAHAAGPDGVAKPKPTELAAAIGALKQADGTTCVVDLRAATREKTGGNLRFMCPNIGTYNGAVRSLSTSGTTATVSGGGGLREADGSREKVQFTAIVSQDDRNVSINVTSADGETYTIAGTLDPGTVRVGVPMPKLHKKATPAAAR